MTAALYVFALWVAAGYCTIRAIAQHKGLR